MKVPAGQAAAEVDVIMRVSNLGHNDIDLDFIVDPATRESNEELSRSPTLSSTLAK